jgi:hypothetical protein
MVKDWLDKRMVINLLYVFAAIVKKTWQYPIDKTTKTVEEERRLQLDFCPSWHSMCQNGGAPHIACPRATPVV